MVQSSSCFFKVLRAGCLRGLVQSDFFVSCCSLDESSSSFNFSILYSIKVASQATAISKQVRPIQKTLLGDGVKFEVSMNP